jgi:hypothetical protein
MGSAGFNKYDFKQITGNVSQETRADRVLNDYQFAEEQSFKFSFAQLPTYAAGNDAPSFYFTGQTFLLTGASGVATGISSVASGFSALTPELVKYAQVDYPVSTSALKIIPNNWTLSCVPSIDGVLIISTGTQQNKKIIYVSDHDIVHLTGTTGVYTLTGVGTSGVRQSGIKDVRVTYQVVSSNSKTPFANGLTADYISISDDGGDSYVAQNTTGYLRQTTPVTGTNFYKLYSGKFNNVANGTWDGIIPSGTPYTIDYYNTGIVPGHFVRSGISLAIFNTGVLTPTGINLEAQKFTQGNSLVPISYTEQIACTGLVYLPRDSDRFDFNDLQNDVKAANIAQSTIAQKKADFIAGLE